MRTSRRSQRWLLAATAAIALLVAACGSDGSADDPDTEPTETESDDTTDDDTADDDTTDDDADAEAEDGEQAADGPITVYSGRNEDFVGFIFDDFEAATGIEVEVRYGDTAELAATIVEEGPASPADVYFAQDAGALGALQAEGLLTELPDDVLSSVEPTFRSREGEWTGTTGRVRVLAYNTDNVDAAELPDSVLELTEPEWEGRVGWAPTNGSFQAFVTALRQTEGEDLAREWLEGMIANGAVEYPNNTGIVEGISRGEVDVGITNHYYLYRFLAEDPDFPVANHYLPGDIGGLVNIAGVGVLESSGSKEAAFELVRYLLSEEVQTYFGQNADTIEFPVVDGVDAPELPSLEEIEPPDVDLSDLEDLQGTLQLLQDVGALS
ncbi:MAG: iron ABC transporter substrate-binding protein [Nitriliruptoraceae bacterium]